MRTGLVTPPTFQHGSGPPPTSLPTAGAPSRTTRLSGPPIVIHTKCAPTTCPPAGMPLITRLRAPPGPPSRRAKPAPSEATPPTPVSVYAVRDRRPVCLSSAAVEKTRMRARVMSGLAATSVTCRPVPSSAPSTVPTLAVGADCLATAHAPAT